jgi:hypothetical protein
MMDTTARDRVFSGLVITFCFAVLAWLNGRYVGVGGGQVALYSLLGLALALACLAGLAGLVLASDAPLRREAGWPGALDAVARGFLILLPFTLLALLTELFFGWGAAQAFTQAGIMTSGAAVGAEVMRRSGQKLKYMVAPMLGVFTFSILWIAFSALFRKVAG